MDMQRIVTVAAIALGVAAGSYGVASAASGSGSSTTATTTTMPAAPAAPSAQQPWGHQRSDETPLTGDALTKVTDAAQAKVAGGTIIRAETDADGNAAYEAHMVKADGTPVTVYVDKNFTSSASTAACPTGVSRRARRGRPRGGLGALRDAYRVVHAVESARADLADRGRSRSRTALLCRAR